MLRFKSDRSRHYDPMERKVLVVTLLVLVRLISLAKQIPQSECGMTLHFFFVGE